MPDAVIRIVTQEILLISKAIEICPIICDIGFSLYMFYFQYTIQNHIKDDKCLQAEKDHPQTTHTEKQSCLFCTDSLPYPYYTLLPNNT